MKILIYSIIASVGFLCSNSAPSSSSASVYKIRSLSKLNSAEVVDMQIALEENGIASVSRTRLSAQDTDQHRVHIATDLVGVTGSMPDHTAVHEFDPLPSGYKLYWIPIDGDVPTIVNSGKRLVVWCDGCEDCNVIIEGNSQISKVICSSRKGDIFHTRDSLEGQKNGGGMYIVAQEVRYE